MTANTMTKLSLTCSACQSCDLFCQAFATLIETASHLLTSTLYHTIPSCMDSDSDWFHPDECEYRDQVDGRDSYLTELLDDMTTLGGCRIGLHLTVAKSDTLHGPHTAQALLGVIIQLFLYRPFCRLSVRSSRLQRFP